MKKNDLNTEFLHYLIRNYGLLNDYDLYEIGITFDEYNNPDENVLLKIESFLDKKNKD